MAEFSSHLPGKFYWVELATIDQKAGVAFYRALFGWDVNEQPIGPTETYSMFLLRGKEVGAAYTMRPEERQSGAPPHWNLYVTVASVDESVKRAEGLGARVFAPPFDVMGAGRMAVLQDPTGAVFQLGDRRSTSARRSTTSQAQSVEQLTTVRHGRVRVVLHRALWLVPKRSGPGQEWNTRSSASRVSRASACCRCPHTCPQACRRPGCRTSRLRLRRQRRESHGTWRSVVVAPQDISKTGRFAILKDPPSAMFAVFKFTGE